MDGVARLSANDRAEIFEATAAQRRLAYASIVEKDFWVCWTLRRLYTIPGMPRLLFKGGTSLSKAFGLIHRFSEDIDLGIERKDIIGLADDAETQCLVGELHPHPSTSGKALKRAVKALRPKVQQYVADTLFPAIEAGFQGALDEKFFLRPDADAEEPTILFGYPRALPTESYGTGDYVQSVVRLELGARSDHEPVRSIPIRPYAAEAYENQFKQPECSVIVQAPERTILEKALIIHAAIHKGSIKK